MIHRKLDATDSTNSYLRALMRRESQPSWTVISTEEQLAGRGQQGASWFSGRSKNLAFSVLIVEKGIVAKDQFLLNCAVSIGIYKVLDRYGVPRLKIKWPNDIMSGSKKLAGILIENSLMKGLISHSIVGIGLNVNQEHFPEDLPQATSMRQLLHDSTNREELLQDLIQSIQNEFDLVKNNRAAALKTAYENRLFLLNKASMFRTPPGEPFLGSIKGVSESGLLKVQKQDGSTSVYGFKEIEYLLVNTSED